MKGEYRGRRAELKKVQRENGSEWIVTEIPTIFQEKSKENLV